MTSLHTDGVITIAAERENTQSKSEEQLWKWLKKSFENHLMSLRRRQGVPVPVGNGPAPGGKPAQA